MDKHAFWKWLILIVAVCGSLALVTRYGLKFGLDLVGGSSFVVQVDTSGMDDDAKKDAQARALEIIRNRVDQMGIAEPVIYPEKGDRIVVQLPGLKEAERDAAERNIKSVGFLEFRMVHKDNDAKVDQLFQQELVPKGYRIAKVRDGNVDRTLYEREGDAAPKPMEDAELLEKLRRLKIRPAGHDLLLRKEKILQQDYYMPFFVDHRAELTGQYLKTAGIDYSGAANLPVVTLKFDGKGAKYFANVTKAYAPGGSKNPNPQGRRFLAIVLDGRLHSAPWIRSAIYGGEAIIEGNFTLAEAQDLMIVLRAGALPSPVTILEKRNVDPSLGKDSIRSGVRAVIFGGVAVLAFMIIYYMLSGLVADVALLLDLVLLPLGMMIVSGFLSLTTGASQTGGQLSLPVLTLPGIAGIVLTIGMAVDANVLIFERIREEYAVGKRIGTAIAAGYDKAFVTILDANVTTLLTAVILFWQGSGAIRGFAVTLSAGILVSMFTALVVTRLFFNLIVSKTQISSLRMLSILSKPNWDFLGKRKWFAIASVVVILSSWAVLGVRVHQTPSAVLGVDFTGGAAVTFDVAGTKPGVDEVRTALSEAGVEGASIQYQKALDGSKEYLEVRTSQEHGPTVIEVVPEKFGDAQFTTAKDDTVGPQIGKELTRKAIIAICAALVGIIIYITWRFEFAFAVGAIAALAHDVLITTGLYTLCGRQLSLPTIAALLTIVGYSVNDTIVVFDRIREDRKLVRNKTWCEICNLSINQTLSRTLLTSITTLITVVILLVFGGGAIHDFALALFIGIVVGTYSSIFIATPVMLLWHRDDKPGK